MPLQFRAAEQDAVMHEELICGWLGLSRADWPPNHYVLLGLEPGETDVARIEHQVHDRMILLRKYQLSHPEAATMAMNRLAQAFTCLTNPTAKKAYDAALLGIDVEEAEPESEPEPAPSPRGLPDLPPLGDTSGDPLAWLFGPWNQLALAPAPPPPTAQVQDWRTAPPPPVRGEPGAEQPTANGAPPAPDEVAAPPPASPPEPAAPPIDHRMEAARSSPSARRGLGTKRALYYRIARTRRLIRAWIQIGKYISQPKRRLTRVREAAEFTAGLQLVLELLRGFPAILGSVGQPGYFVVILAQQQMPVPTFRALVQSQREELARDWQDAHTLLLHHQQFLRQELRALRRKSAWGRALRAFRSSIKDQPGKFLLLLALLALLVALWLPFLLHVLSPAH